MIIDDLKGERKLLVKVTLFAGVFGLSALTTSPLAFCPLQVLFGTADGQVIVMDCHGRMLAHILLHESDGIVGMSWNFPSFQVEDSSESDTDSDDSSPPPGSRRNYLKHLKTAPPVAVI